MRWAVAAIGAMLLVPMLPGAQASQAAGPAPISMTLHADRQGPDVLQPGGEAGLWALTVEYHTNVPTPEEITIDLSAHSNDHWGVDIEPSQLSFRPAGHAEPGAHQTITLDATIQAQARPHAPAFHAERIVIEATSDGSALASPTESLTQLTAIAAYRPGLQVEGAQESVEVPEGDETHVRTELSNHGNGDTRVTYDAIAAPEGCTVDPIHEATVIERHETEEAIFHLACESGVEDGELTVTYAQAYAPDTSRTGPDVTETWQVDVEPSTAAQTQAALIGITVTVGGIPHLGVRGAGDRLALGRGPLDAAALGGLTLGARVIGQTRWASG